ncbi:hypothetical protein [Dyadobacter sediminis]|uniref:Uncharacterized protein n=1 Tax=Dyadobacter sediminis TaxID=1493691 RepID=A0A5R9KB61_9BACT|nr:hypothetical protein [Dyadobacter sediminis]TLU91979.1 hypothetical protein FEM55_14555 [Dyadobacter sediminis]GGB98544.1 hypothetical protein GCM10011325_27260 [Dyadobacter sediminis]
MRVFALFMILYVLFDIRRRLWEKDKFVTQKEFEEYKALQAASNTQVGKRLDSMESSAFS